MSTQGGPFQDLRVTVKKSGPKLVALEFSTFLLYYFSNKRKKHIYSLRYKINMNLQMLWDGLKRKTALKEIKTV
jgi:hypothetical protein